MWVWRMSWESGEGSSPDAGQAGHEPDSRRRDGKNGWILKLFQRETRHDLATNWIRQEMGVGWGEESQVFRMTQGSACT